MSRPTSKPQPPAKRNSLVIIGALLAVVLAGIAYSMWSTTPQLVADSEVYGSLDALFTAVTAQRQPLVANCERELASLHRDGRIPEKAWRKIVRVIDLTKANQWEHAARDLYGFIEGQRVGSRALEPRSAGSE